MGTGNSSPWATATPQDVLGRMIYQVRERRDRVPSATTVHCYTPEIFNNLVTLVGGIDIVKAALQDESLKIEAGDQATLDYINQQLSHETIVPFPAACRASLFCQTGSL